MHTVGEKSVCFVSYSIWLCLIWANAFFTVLILSLSPVALYLISVPQECFFFFFFFFFFLNWAPSSEFVSSSIPSWQTLTAHAQPFRVARDLAFCLKVPLDSLLVWASSEGSGETARMRRLAWTFAARIGSKYQIRLTRSSYACNEEQVRTEVSLALSYSTERTCNVCKSRTPASHTFHKSA